MLKHTKRQVNEFCFPRCVLLSCLSPQFVCYFFLRIHWLNTTLIWTGVLALSVNTALVLESSQSYARLQSFSAWSRYLRRPGGPEDVSLGTSFFVPRRCCNLLKSQKSGSRERREWYLHTRCKYYFSCLTSASSPPHTIAITPEFNPGGEDRNAFLQENQPFFNHR